MSTNSNNDFKHDYINYIICFELYEPIKYLNIFCKVG